VVQQHHLYTYIHTYMCKHAVAVVVASVWFFSASPRTRTVSRCVPAGRDTATPPPHLTSNGCHVPRASQDSRPPLPCTRGREVEQVVLVCQACACQTCRSHTHTHHTREQFKRNASHCLPLTFGRTITLPGWGSAWMKP
jgi:hypothetical protein